MEFPDVMVDIETTGTRPDRSGIIQISAVRFNLAAQTVDAADMFDRCLSLKPGRYWDEDTRNWWHGRNLKVLRQIQARMEDPRKIVEDFAQWVGYTPDEPIRFWSKPTTFDFTFLASYFADYGMPNPFHYRFARDLNTFMAGMAGTAEHPKVEVEFNGDAHNALHDVLHQIKLLFAAKQELAA